MSMRSKRIGKFNFLSTKSLNLFNLSLLDLNIFHLDSGLKEMLKYWMS